MQLLYALESIRTPVWNALMSAVTHLGEETVFMAAALFVFWCVGKRQGYYLLAVGFAGTVLNQFLKLLFRIPRPWVLDENFTIVESARAGATGYSFPSGHTLASVIGAMALKRADRRVGYFAIPLAVLIAFSRLYLFVHVPSDVLFAALLGLAIGFTGQFVFNRLAAPGESAA